LGSGDRAAAGRIAGEGLLLAAFLSLPLVAVVVSFDRVLLVLGYDPALAAEIGHFLRAIAWGAPASIGFATLRRFLAAQARTRPVMAVLFAGVAMNAGLNWVLIYGNLGAPALGLVGSGYATAINYWVMLGITAGYIAWAPGLKDIRVFGGIVARRF